MKKLTHTIFIVLLFVCSYIDAEIIETAHFNEIENYIPNKDILVILDIDNTLIEPVQELGTDQWFYHRLQEYIAKGLNSAEALDITLAEWHAIQSITKMQLVEKQIDETVAHMQKNGYTIMGLTTRGLSLSTRTVEQLHSVGVNLTKTAPTQEEIFFKNGLHYVLFRGGALFTAATHKGKALFTFLDAIDYKPKSVVFINDKATHLREVEVACIEKGIPFIGLRYGYTDERVKNFRKDIADIQFEHFGHILSDKSAENILKGI